MIIVRSNLFLSSNANHPIGLPHPNHTRFCPMLVSLSATVVSVFFFCFFLCFFLLFHAVHRPSLHAICINSTSPCRVNQSVSSQQVCFLSTQSITHTVKFPLTYCITSFTSQSALTTPKQRCSGYKCFMRCLPEFNACVRMTRVWRVTLSPLPGGVVTLDCKVRPKASSVILWVKLACVM